MIRRRGGSGGNGRRGSLRAATDRGGRTPAGAPIAGPGRPDAPIRRPALFRIDRTSALIGRLARTGLANGLSSCPFSVSLPDERAAAAARVRDAPADRARSGLRGPLQLKPAKNFVLSGARPETPACRQRTGLNSEHMRRMRNRVCLPRFAAICGALCSDVPAQGGGRLGAGSGLGAGSP